MSQLFGVTLVLETNHPQVRSAGTHIPQRNVLVAGQPPAGMIHRINRRRKIPDDSLLGIISEERNSHRTSVRANFCKRDAAPIGENERITDGDARRNLNRLSAGQRDAVDMAGSVSGQTEIVNNLSGSTPIRIHLAVTVRS